MPIELAALFSITRRGIRRIEQVDWVRDTHGASVADETGADVHVTAGISGRDPRGRASGHVGELRVKYAARSFGLDQIVNARASAALVGVAQRRQLEGGDRGKHGERRLHQHLPDLAGDLVLTSERQHEAIVRAISGLRTAGAALAVDVPHEMALLDLYQSLSALGELTGEVATDDLLDRIFSTFCIGK